MSEFLEQYFCEYIGLRLHRSHWRKMYFPVSFEQAYGAGTGES